MIPVKTNVENRKLTFGRMSRKVNHYMKVVSVVLSGALALSLAACGNSTTTNQHKGHDQSTTAEQNQNQQLLVYTSFYPLYYVTSQIGGEYVQVKNVVPAGVEPHDYEPTTKDIVDMSKAAVFVHSGTTFETWVEKALSNFDKSKMTVVNAAEGIQLLEASEGIEHEGEASSTEGEAHEHEHDGLDPHIWLDPTLLKVEAAKVKDALIKADQAHQATYQQNFDKLAQELDKLDKEYQEMVSKAPRKEFMVSHSAFGYLAHKYGLEQVAISGLSPSDEPSTTELKGLIEHVKEHKINTIFFETLASPKVAEVIAKETGAKTATLNPLEGLTEEEMKQGKDYLSVMRENLEALRSALQE